MVNDEQIETTNRFKQWVNRRLLHAKQNSTPFTVLCGHILSIILIFEIYFVVPGISTGLGILIDYVIITFIYIAIIYIVGRLIVPILKFLYVSTFTYPMLISISLLVQSYIITKQIGWNNKTAIIFSLIVFSFSLLFSIVVSYLWFNKRKWTWVTVSLIVASLVITFSIVKQNQLKQATPVAEPEILHSILVEQQNETHYSPIMLQSNPAQLGDFTFTHIQYDSNDSSKEEAIIDLDEENKYKDVYFPPVDGSGLLSDWSWSKELYWGFTESEIPITGDLWIPDGEGPFPIVYIMHGNHISETDSSIGYTYLAELLASHGYIVSSIDANFLNYSVWSGIVDNDQVLRAWLFLAHINTFYDANIFPIDWSNVALIGHSRGGQAAAMAVDINKWIEYDERVNILDKVNINTVVGIAPTDYTVDGKLAYLKDVNYLTIHGTLDSDLTEFFGERQFERTRLNEQTYKASVIIYGANHGQFNEAWGKYDDQFPAALILNTEHILDEKAQQQAAKVYISGFIQSIFDEKHEYRQLFQDSRVLQNELPIAGYITQYEDNNMHYYYTFDNDKKLDKISSSPNLKYEIVELKGRNGSTKYNDVLSVKWTIGYSKLVFPITNQMKRYEHKPISAFVFQVAKTMESPNVKQITDMNIEVDFLTTDAISRVNLNNNFNLLDPYYPIYLKLDFLEDDIKKGKYEPKEEPYLQTYIIPINLIKKNVQFNQNWQVEDLTAINFWFKDKTGAVMIDDIGVIYEGGSYVKYE